MTDDPSSSQSPQDPAGPAPQQDPPQTGQQPKPHALPKAEAAPSLYADAVDGLISFKRGIVTEQCFKDTCGPLVLLGTLASLLAIVLFVVLGVIDSINQSDFGVLGRHLAFAIGMAAVLYTALKFASAADHWIPKAPSKLSSDSLPNCLAVLLALAGLGLFINALIAMFQNGQVSVLLNGVNLLVIFGALAAAVLQPGLTNTSIEEGNNPGQECLGLLGLVFKAALRAAPLIFGAVVTISVGGYVYTTIGGWVSDNPMFLFWQSVWLQDIVMFGLAPLAAFVAFLIGYLLIDLYRAVLTLLDRRP